MKGETPPREKVPQRRMRDTKSSGEIKPPHPAFGHLPPEGKGK